MLRLVRPSIKYKKSFLGAVKEFQREGRYADYNYDALKKDFPAFIKGFKDKEKGINLPVGWVASSVYWLVDGEKFIGRISVRHKLTPHLRREGGGIGYEIRPTERRKGYGSMILALGLKKAKAMGFKKVLLTCNKENIGSKKIIEKNGGVLAKPYRLESGKIKLRYWIKII